MNKKNLTRIIAATALVITAGGGYALGASTPFALNSEGTFYACVTGVNGNITKVTNTPKTCPKGTTPITWNSVGPKGDKGDKGDTGEAGSAYSPPTTYLESPDGTQRYPFTLNGVYVNGYLFQWNGSSLEGSQNYAGYLFARVYKSANCTGSESYLRVGSEALPPAQIENYAGPQAALSYWEYGPSGHLGTYTGLFQLAPNLDFVTLSYWTVEGCETISNVSQDFLNIKNNAQMASDYVRANGLSEYHQFMAQSCELFYDLDGSTVDIPNCVPPQSSIWAKIPGILVGELDLQESSMGFYDLVPVQVPDATGWKVVVR